MKALFLNFLQILRGNGEVATIVAISKKYFSLNSFLANCPVARGDRQFCNLSTPRFNALPTLMKYLMLVFNKNSQFRIFKELWTKHPVKKGAGLVDFGLAKIVYEFTHTKFNFLITKSFL